LSKKQWWHKGKEGAQRSCRKKKSTTEEKIERFYFFSRRESMEQVCHPLRAKDKIDKKNGGGEGESQLRRRGSQLRPRQRRSRGRQLGEIR